jgi:hypothetical protein
VDPFQLLHHFRHRLGVFRFGQLALGRFQDQRVAAVGLFGQVVFEQFGGGRRVGPRQGQVFARLAARGVADCQQRDREDHPGGDHRVVVA